jgi:hypothetical protein
MMNMIQNENKQLGGPLLAQTEYHGDTSSRGAGDNSIDANLNGNFRSNADRAARELAGTN